MAIAKLELARHQLLASATATELEPPVTRGC